ncbi:uncharacterized protein LOC143859021 [Tasmannia lanceolata]|uniref:uncharacterized protein LOC143859021 n=1 Tax=Tasmannia lanceolata TaxID=3420 RepID=UPI00406343EE
MVIKNLVNGLPNLNSFGSGNVCEGYQYGKAHCLLFDKSLSRCKAPLELIHSDVMGPCRTPSFPGFRYMLLFVDDFTRFTWVYFIREKSDALCKMMPRKKISIFTRLLSQKREIISSQLCLYFSFPILSPKTGLEPHVSLSPRCSSTCCCIALFSHKTITESSVSFFFKTCSSFARLDLESRLSEQAPSLFDVYISSNFVNTCSTYRTDSPLTSKGRFCDCTMTNKTFKKGKKFRGLHTRLKSCFQVTDEYKGLQTRLKGFFSNVKRLKGHNLHFHHALLTDLSPCQIFYSNSPLPTHIPKEVFFTFSFSSCDALEAQFPPGLTHVARSG